MTGGFLHPAFLWLLPLALLPCLVNILRVRPYPSIAAVPDDVLSRVIDWTLLLAAVVAIAAIILSMAGPYIGGGSIERLGQGAETVLLIDRSGSMNETFAGHTPKGVEESKAGAARRVLEDYVRHRPHDRFGMIGFSTAPIAMLPMTDRAEAVLAAVASIDRPGLNYTDIGRGLAMAVDTLAGGSREASRVVLLVSDGAAVIGTDVQEKLRAAFARTPVHLYWLFLRTANSNGISTVPNPGEDNAQAMPERHLDRFFKSLGIPYRAFEVENPGAVDAAVTEIGRLETHAIRYREHIALRDFTPFTTLLAFVATLFIVLAKVFETSTSPAYEIREVIHKIEPLSEPRRRAA